MRRRSERLWRDPIHLTGHYSRPDFSPERQKWVLCQPADRALAGDTTVPPDRPNKLELRLGGGSRCVNDLNLRRSGWTGCSITVAPFRG
jgi:hypothetical protein